MGLHARLAYRTLQHHTRMQQAAPCLHVDKGVRDGTRPGTLANVDREVLFGLDHDEIYRMVRLPISDAVWSPWKRYCRAVGVPKGRAVVALIVCELCTIVEDPTDAGDPVFVGRVEEELAARESKLAVRERALATAEAAGELQACDQRLDAASKLTGPIGWPARR